MALSWIADAHTCTTQSEVDSLITSHTCPTDGYVYAWPDPNNPLLVWTVSVCPADSVTPTLANVIADAVATRYNTTDTTLDPHLRTEAIIAGVKSDASTWLYTHTTTDIANFLSQDSKLQTSILSAMATAGAINLIAG